MGFESNVFINCPFDDEYKPMLKALVFTSIYLNLVPHVSETISSSNTRIDQIKRYIRKSKFGIHDISRNKAMVVGDLPRFNMPYELGLDIGACEFGGKILKSKKILILDTERYHYQKVISDISGQDISAHNDEPKTLILKVRNWLSSNTEDIVLASTNEIWIAYNQFIDDLTSILSATYTEEELKEMPISDYIKFTNDWIKKFKQI